MSGVITQDELDSLLTAIEVAGQRRRPATEAVTAALYDFRYASRLSPDQMRLLQGRVVSLITVLNRTMSLYLNNAIHFEIHSLDVVSYEQYVRNLAVNPVLGVIAFDAGTPPVLWEVPAPLAHVISDCMLGGRGNATADANLEATALECAVLRRLFQEILSAWVELWDRLGALNPRVQDVVSSAGAADLHAVDERVFCMTLEVTLAETQGLLRLSLPLAVVKRLLRDERQVATLSDLREADADASAAAAVSDAPVPVVAYLEPPPLPLGALASLQPGDTLDLRLPADQPLAVSVAGRRKFMAHAGFCNGRVACQVIEMVGGEHQP